MRHTPHNCPEGCDICLALGHTDLDGLPDANWDEEPKLVLVPLTVLRQMQSIVNAPNAASDSADTLDRWASLSSILDTVLPEAP